MLALPIASWGTGSLEFGRGAVARFNPCLRTLRLTRTC